MDLGAARVDAGGVTFVSPAPPAPRFVDSAQPVLAVIGPSGSGKSILVQTLARSGEIVVHPTWTTRPQRPEERGGCVEHRFVSEAAFTELESSQLFWATATVFGLGYRYGLPFVVPSYDERLDVVMLRSPFVPRFRAWVPGALVYQIEPGPGHAEARLAERGGPAIEKEARLEDNVKKLAAGRAVADRVFVNDRSIDHLCAAVRAALSVDAHGP